MKKTIAIVGGGSSALMLACELNTAKYNVTIFEKNNALGRKFLVAGDGGLNLTHSEDLQKFVQRYTPHHFLKTALIQFSNTHFIEWLKETGVETFTGSSGRIFPKKGMKPVQVLNLILEKIKQNKVAICTQHEWKGFSGENELLFENKNSTLKVNFDIVVFCLGGASWPVTGSDGKWTDHFLKKGISILPFAASNCAFEVKWDPTFIHKMAGKALKNITITCGDQYLAGEIVLTKFGIEGSGIYPLSPVLREQLHKHSFATISIDLKPSLEETTIVERLNEEKNKNITEQLKMRLNFNPLQIQLLKHQLSKEEFTHPQTLANRIKHFKVKITGTGPIEDAISTTGGISLSEINENFKLSKLKGVYAIGEMLDFDAPTGGYLLQSCFSMGHYLANHLNSLPIL